MRRKGVKAFLTSLLAVAMILPAWMTSTIQAEEAVKLELGFEDGLTGGFTGRAGTEVLTVTNEANHTDGGSKSLKIEGRSDSWHGPTLRVEQLVEADKEYEISAWVKLIEPASTTLQLSTQIGQGSAASYNALASTSANAGDGWIKLEGTYRYNSLGDGYSTIYVEAPSSKNASFYVDDIRIASTGTVAPEVQTDLLPIKDIYEDDFLIGNATSAEDLEGSRLQLLSMHHNVATAGNAMKPDALQKVKGQFTFAAADAMVNKVLAEDMSMHGHVLVWHQQSPAWMNSTKDGSGAVLPLSRAEALENMRIHIRTVVEHFGNRVISWDVVNEAMSDNPSNPTDWKNALRKSMWYNAIGPDFVEEAFQAAREVLDEHPEWDVKLYYNDYNEDNQNKATAIASMVQELNDNYAADHPGKKLIDGIGMQGHYGLNTNPTNVQLSLERFINTGVEVSVTELDIQAGSNYVMTDKEANSQGYLYAQLMDLYRQYSDNISRVTFWGMDDGTSWRAASNPLLFDKHLQAKPAYYAVADPATFMEEHVPDTTGAKYSQALYGTPVIDGQMDAIWNQVPAIQVNRYQMAWQGASGIAKALWDENNLYVLVQVSDNELDKTSENVWEHDSVEVFLDQNNGKTTFYQEDDGQYRINYDNETSFNPESIGANVETQTKVSGTNYIVEMKIPLTAVTPDIDTKLGFDVQINDGKAGARESIATWNDTTGNAYQDTLVYGILTLKGKSTINEENAINGGGGDSHADYSTPPAWAKEAVDALAANGIMLAADKNSFSPDVFVTRAEFAALLVRTLGLVGSGQQTATFADVRQESVYSQGIQTAQQLGIINGFSDQTFRPDDPITRQDMMVMTTRALHAAGKEFSGERDLGSYRDKSDVADYALDSVAILVKAGVVGGKSNKLAPTSTLSRAEAAVILYRTVKQ
ncbi:endo-1,4-beta-xylanase [Paenibacillus sp. Marseille-Q4541]|uniref:endo-1,4-beta-xylanase n=1 Tax=Paenibacillus sp. Marseille-Q4541 TaxID=2831522 RepID=UPI001BA7BB08|nr:endo-1,4-beta-xylanase [Paenibacillus sp. Marseille-Q4541]